MIAMDLACTPKALSWLHRARLFKYSSSFPFPLHPSVDLTIFLIPLLLSFWFPVR
jgi:hypothetical protein